MQGICHISYSKGCLPKNGTNNAVFKKVIEIYLKGYK